VNRTRMNRTHHFNKLMLKYLPTSHKGFTLHTHQGCYGRPSPLQPSLAWAPDRPLFIPSSASGLRQRCQVDEEASWRRRCTPAKAWDSRLPRSQCATFRMNPCVQGSWQQRNNADQSNGCNQTLPLWLALASIYLTSLARNVYSGRKRTCRTDR
jgi:hypothetical protein